MFIPTSTKLTAYADGDFRVIVAEFPDRFEAWLSHESCGVAELMYGLPKRNETDNLEVTEEDFVNFTEASLWEYKANFLNDHPEINLPSD